MSTYIVESVGQLELKTGASNANIKLTPHGTGYIDAPELRLSSAELAVAYGGTGAANASDARTNLGLAIGSDVQAYDQALADLAGASPSSGQVLKYNGSNWAAAADSNEAITASAPLSRSGDDISLSLNASHLEESGGSLQIKASAVDTTEIADDAVTSAKIAANVQLEGPSISSHVQFNSSNANAHAQTMCLYQATANDTPVEVVALTMLDGERWAVKVSAVAYDDSASDSAAYEAHALFYRDGASSARLSAANVNVIHETAGAAAWGLNLDVNASHQVYAGVTGDATNETRWSIRVDAVRVI